MRALIVVLVAACGGAQKPPEPPPFDAAGLAARLDHLMAEMEAAIAQRDDCPRMLDTMSDIEVRAQAPIAEAHAAQKDRQHVHELALAMKQYEHSAAGRADAIAMALAICYQGHPDLRDRVKHVVDSMPTI